MENEDRTSDAESSAGNGRDGHNRRTFLKGVTTATVSAGALTTAASAQDYEEIVVGAGETFTKYLSDGETWSNKLIDITADGAGYYINATGDNWAIRNLGVRGAWDHDPGSQQFVVMVDSPDATGVMENIYLGDGAAYDRSYSPYPSGFYVHAYHAGDLEVNNYHAANFTSHGMYASGPGNPDNHSLPGGGGAVRVHDSYCADLENSGFRIGTDSSYLDNCVAFRTVRGWWQYYENSTAYDCEFGDNGTDVVVGDSNYAKDATATVDNTRFETYSTPDGSLNGSSSGTPQEYVPAGCPTTPEEAASGGSGGDGPDEREEVAEDFSHADVPGTYSLDTGAFTTSTARSTTDSYSLVADDDANGSRIVLREDMEVTAGNTYELDVYHQSASGADVGFLFGAQSGISGWGDYTGYFGFFESDDDEIRVDRLENGSWADSAATSTTWPLDEWLTVELDYRDTVADAITMTVSDASGSEVASVSLTDATYDSGVVGWYNYHAGADWHADSWFHADQRDGGPTVIEDFERSDPLAAYGGRTGLYSTTSAAYEGSTALINDGGAYGSLVSTSGLDAYPDRGDDVTCYYDNASADNFMAVHLFAQSETDVPDSYAVGLGGAGGWRIWRLQDGSTDVIASQDLSTSEQIDGWYRAEIQTDSTTITADLYDDATDDLIASIQTDDTTYSSGGIGFRSVGNGEVWDYVVRDE